MLTQGDTWGSMSGISPLSLPAAASGDTGASARAEESAVLRLENPPLLSRLGGGAWMGEGPRKPPVSAVVPAGDNNKLPLCCRFCPAPDVRAHLQSAQHEQRRDLAVRQPGLPAPGTYRPRGSAAAGAGGPVRVVADAAGPGCRLSCSCRSRFTDSPGAGLRGTLRSDYYNPKPSGPFVAGLCCATSAAAAAGTGPGASPLCLPPAQPELQGGARRSRPSSNKRNASVSVLLVSSPGSSCGAGQRGAEGVWDPQPGLQNTLGRSDPRVESISACSSAPRAAQCSVPWDKPKPGQFGSFAIKAVSETLRCEGRAAPRRPRGWEASALRHVTGCCGRITTSSSRC